MLPMIKRDKRKARIKLKIGPAAITEIRAQTDLLPKEPSSVVASSSPSMAQEPPKGRSFQEYRVPPFTVLKILGPMPRENSSTVTPLYFARRK